MTVRDTASFAVTRAQRVSSALRRRIYPLDVVVRAGQQFMNDNAMTYAAATSYYVLFSLFPLMIFLVTMFGFFVRDPELHEQVVDAVVRATIRIGIEFTSIRLRITCFASQGQAVNDYLSGGPDVKTAPARTSRCREPVPAFLGPPRCGGPNNQRTFLWLARFASSAST
jgi:hypothetical protein